jgi:hypothetical protein
MPPLINPFALSRTIEDFLQRKRGKPKMLDVRNCGGSRRRRLGDETHFVKAPPTGGAVSGLLDLDRVYIV